MAEQTVEQLAGVLDKPTATLLISDDVQTRHFILESLVTAAALYLLKRYADAFLKGAGFDEMAKEHGKKTKEFIEDIRSGSATPEYLERSKVELEATLVMIRTKPRNEAAQKAALAAVEAVIIERGGVSAQARNVAALVAQAALKET